MQRSLLLGGCTHKDMNVTRAIDYGHEVTAKEREYVDDAFGKEYL